MKVGKPKSKRVPVRLRHKIEKASAAKQRKQRKEAKKTPQWRSRLKKDPGIPNLFPYKAKVLAEIEENKRKKEEEALRRREVAKAQRQGKVVADVEEVAATADEGEDAEVLLDHEEDAEEEDVMDEQEDSNPMAALLASAQARAQAYGHDEDPVEKEDGDEDEEWSGIEDDTIQTPPDQSTRKVLPKQALADPIKAVSALLERMRRTIDGIQRLMDYYQMPPLVTAGGELSSSFLVEIARKRGRLGRGGVPNLHSAALIVLNDLNEERLELPAVESANELKKVDASGKGGVQIVSKMAEPFGIEGLWGDDAKDSRVAMEAMVAEA